MYVCILYVGDKSPQEYLIIKKDAVVHLGIIMSRWNESIVRKIKTLFEEKFVWTG